MEPDVIGGPVLWRIGQNGVDIQHGAKGMAHHILSHQCMEALVPGVQKGVIGAEQAQQKAAQHQ